MEPTGRFNLSAYERVQAAEALRLNYGRDSAKKIVTMLHEALEIEPDDPVTRAALAVQLSQNVVSQWAEDPAATISRAPHHPRFSLWATYRATGHLFMLNYVEGLRGGEHAVERTPNYYQPHLTCAWAHTGLGDTQSAKREIQRARRLESEDILDKFVDEMRKWAKNSPNREQCWEVLEALRLLRG